MELEVVSLIIAFFVLIENTIALTWLGKRMSADHRAIIEDHKAIMETLERISERLATSPKS